MREVLAPAGDGLIKLQPGFEAVFFFFLREAPLRLYQVTVSEKTTNELEQNGETSQKALRTQSLKRGLKGVSN